MNNLVVHIHNKHTYMASMNQLTKMAVDQSCNRFQISLIRYLGLSHQQLPIFISLFKRLLKLTFYFHQHFHLLCSIVHWYQITLPSSQIRTAATAPNLHFSHFPIPFTTLLLQHSTINWKTTPFSHLSFLFDFVVLRSPKNA
jgi:hypothetical protein